MRRWPDRTVRATASFSFYNNDGAMTPGGGGTYSSIDWFAMAIKVEYSTSQAAGTCFAGIITDYKLVDDGRNSYVSISAVDAFTIGGSTATTVNTGAGTYGGTVDYWINSFYNGNTTIIQGFSYAMIVFQIGCKKKAPESIRRFSGNCSKIISLSLLQLYA